MLPGSFDSLLQNSPYAEYSMIQKWKKMIVAKDGADSEQSVNWRETMGEESYSHSKPWIPSIPWSPNQLQKGYVIF
jgi:hypothetical protein